MTYTHAITRRPGREVAAGITTSTLGSPDYTKTIEQFERVYDTKVAGIVSGAGDLRPGMVLGKKLVSDGEIHEKVYLRWLDYLYWDPH